MSNLRRPPPLWKLPVGTETSIHVYNSLTKTKSPLVLTSDTLKWYTCGPTPYDDAHLGHARNYVMTDVLRRILRDYFGIKIKFVMNVTDIDDKIILRARQRHLLRAFRASNSQDLHTIKDALHTYTSKNLQYDEKSAGPAQILRTLSSTYKDLLARDTSDDVEAKQKMYAKTALGASKAAMALETHDEPAEKDQDHLDDILSMHLDAIEESPTSYDYANDHTIFTELAQEYERRFMEDMQALDVLDPDETTRVSEYIPQVIDFVSKIENKGFAYKTPTGVYFDVGAFERANNHYARLEPSNRNNSALQAEGEGAISGKQHSEKRDPADFALWKLSKPREPSWPSPWGGGRPGWHIECSAMASDKLGSNLDIHSGGIDLAFPHHDNELAQSEAYWTEGSEHQWVNYFLHTGHLSIAGAKMSKSLKNFTKVRDALQDGTWTSRGLRITLLQGAWREGIEITEAVTKTGAAWEDKVNNFFLKAKEVGEKTDLAALLDKKLDVFNFQSMLQPSNPPEKIDQSTQPTSLSVAKSLDEALERAKLNVFLALSDSFNTAAVMNSISELITFYNSSDPPPPGDDTIKVAQWITNMVYMLGLNGTATPSSTTIGWSGLDIPAEARPALTAISSLRDTIRAKARSPSGLTVANISEILAEYGHSISHLDPKQPFTEVFVSFQQALARLSLDVPISDSNDDNKLNGTATTDLSKSALALSDRIRDTDLWNLGIYLEDPPSSSTSQQPQPALIRPVTTSLRAQRAEKEQQATQKAQAKLLREAEARKKEKEMEARAKVRPEEMFRVLKEYEGLFGSGEGAFDEEGMPKADAEGVELPRSRLKKLRKEWERQRRLYDGFVVKEREREWERGGAGGKGVE